MDILSISLLTSLIVNAAAKLIYYLHMMQQNSYRNERFFKWIKPQLTKPLLITEAVALLVSGLLILAHLQGEIPAVAIVTVIAVQLLTRKQKKKIAYTPRLIRLLIMSAIILLFTGVLSWALVIGIEWLFICWFVVVLIIPIVLTLANKLMAPVELYINKSYYNDAKRILQSMPALKIIGITGSYGKTSTKHFLHRILSEKYNTLMTPGSYNTTMGVIRTIREYLKPTHEIFIVEMGAKQLGDIKEICDLVHPETAILTAVGEQHLETFKSIENVQKTKFELIDALPENGKGVINADYEYIRNRNHQKNSDIVSYSAQGYAADFHIPEIVYTPKGMLFSIFKGENKLLDLETKLLGSYNASNIMASCIIAMHLGMKPEQISYAVKKLEPVQHRLEIKRNPNGITILDDAFNSNPEGAAMALEVLGKIQGGKKIIVTPGMIELGDKQFEYNKNFGQQIAEVCTYVVLVGKKQTVPILQGLQEKQYPENQIFVAANLNEATTHLNALLQQGDIVLYENDLPDTYAE